MSLSSTHHAGVRPSTLHLPRGDWATVLDCLCAHFPAISREVWLERMARGRVLGADGLPLGPQQAYREGMRVHYFREVPTETPIPFVERILHCDEHLLVVDKPHFLPVVPSGGYVEQTLLARLVKRLDNPQLVPIHRIDRLTAGLVLFSVNPQSRNHYQQLFRQRDIRKGYEAIAPALAEPEFPLVRRTRMVEAKPFFRMQEAEGPPNSETRIEVREVQGALCRYGLYPLTGKKHQLRVHLAALGAGICNDPFYPELTAASDAVDDYSRPLKLLAQELAFTDPLSGAQRHFRSELQLDW
ncbi:ribosomal large subunit pseudouridine synthase D [Pseudomonas pohangensis]|uniref:Ribosomal large subunit pseudouridine synthase D n=1 Tax=Pseudomonas pohangensis TaxID=364197 RepID=A0A1H2FXI3_9PSED|nr:pseudouridine synthase [Pseudomonas pohangensis]SDU12013.1 ribosomal large subunit pseudouridine synthase D [Pseudomonas pohangensis]